MWEKWLHTHTNHRSIPPQKDVYYHFEGHGWILPSEMLKIPLANDTTNNDIIFSQILNVLTEYYSFLEETVEKSANGYIFSKEEQKQIIDVIYVITANIARIEELRLKYSKHPWFVSLINKLLTNYWIAAKLWKINWVNWTDEHLNIAATRLLEKYELVFWEEDKSKYLEIQPRSNEEFFEIFLASWDFESATKLLWTFLSDIKKFTKAIQDMAAAILANTNSQYSEAYVILRRYWREIKNLLWAHANLEWKYTRTPELTAAFHFALEESFWVPLEDLSWKVNNTISQKEKLDAMKSISQSEAFQLSQNEWKKIVLQQLYEDEKEIYEYDKAQNA